MLSEGILVGGGGWIPWKHTGLERAENVETEEFRVQGTWWAGSGHIVAFRLAGEMKSRCFRAQHRIHL